MTECDKLQHLIKSINEEAFRIIVVVQSERIARFSVVCLRLQEAETRCVARALPPKAVDSTTIVALTGSAGVNIRQVIRKIVREERALCSARTYSGNTTPPGLHDILCEEVVAAMRVIQPSRPTYTEIM